MTLRLNSVETQLGEPERVRRNGEEYLRVPTAASRQQIYDYEDVPEAEDHEFLPEAELSAVSQRINSAGGIPIALDHPVAQGSQGLQPVSVDSPQAITTTDVGTFENTRVNATEEGPKLLGEMLLRVDEARTNGATYREAFDALEDGGTVPVSLGYDVGDLDRTTGRHNGEQYDAIQRDLQPDHLAIVLNGTARCSPSQGCAAGRANASLPTNDDGQVTFRAMTDASDDSADDPAGLTDVSRRNAFGMLLDRLLGKDTDERQNAAEHLDLPDDTRDTTDDQREDESADADTADTTDTTSTTMDDSDKIDELVDDHGLDRENMEPLEGEDCLDDIYERFNAEVDADGGETTEGDTTETPDEPSVEDADKATGASAEGTFGGEPNDTEDGAESRDTSEGTDDNEDATVTFDSKEELADFVDEQIERRENSKECDDIREDIRANSEQFGEGDLVDANKPTLLSIREMVVDERENAQGDASADMGPVQTQGPVRQNAELDTENAPDTPVAGDPWGDAGGDTEADD